MRTLPLVAALPPKFQRIEVDEHGCWLWTGAVSQRSYGRVYWPGTQTTRFAHRVIYELFVGEITEESLDHLCRTPRCVNPSHLEPVSLIENIRRGTNVLAVRNAAKTHCPQGHPYDDENTRVVQDKRYCRACGRIRMRSRRSA